MKIRFHEQELFLACRTLFGPGVRYSPDFLDYLQAGGVRAAFREKVKQNHPDLFAEQGSDIQNQRTESFRDVLKAFNLIRDFLKHRDETSMNQISSLSKPHKNYRENSPDPPPTTVGHFYRGALPSRRLEFGSYLYYRGVISYRALLAALAWQRRQRPTIGDLARRWKWLNETEVSQICQERSVYGRFGEKAIQLDLLTLDQVRTLLAFQRTRQQKIGQYFIESGLLSLTRVEGLVKEMQLHNLRFNQPPTDCFNRAPAAG